MGNYTNCSDNGLYTAREKQFHRGYVNWIYGPSKCTKSTPGNKKDDLTIIYTPADNLKKTGDMEVGQVSFHSDKKVRGSFIFMSS